MNISSINSSIDDKKFEEILELIESLCRCPISSAIFYKPIVADDCHLYERTTLAEYLDRFDKRSPMNRQTIGKNYRPIENITNIINKLVTFKKGLKDEVFCIDISYENNKGIIINFLKANTYSKLVNYNKFKLFDVINFASCSCSEYTQNTTVIDLILTKPNIDSNVISHILLNSIDFALGDCQELENYICKYCFDDKVVDLMITNGYTFDEPDSKNLTPFYYACKFNNIPIINKLLELGIYSINNILGNNKLIKTLVKNKNITIIQKFIDMGLEYNEPILDDMNLLHLACQYNNVDLITCLLNIGADINIKDNNNIYPLDIYLKAGGSNMEIIKRFVISWDIINSSITILIINACKCNNMEILEYLYNIGKINENTVDSSIFDILIESKSKLEFFKFFVKNGVDILGKINTNDYKESILCKACDKLMYELIDYLIDQNITINLDSIFEKIVVSLPPTLLIEKFIKKGCVISNDIVNKVIINGLSNLNNYNTIEYILDCAKTVDIDTDINLNKKLIHTLLEKSKRFNIIKKCVDKLPHLAYPDSNNWYPIHYALRYQSPEIIQYIADRTINISDCITNDGYTPIHFACLYSTRDIIYYFIFDKNQNVNVPVTKYKNKDVEYSCINFIELNEKIESDDKDVLISMLCEMF